MTAVHHLTGAYAVNAIDDLERLRFEKHLNECPDCQAEVESLQEASAALAHDAAIAPPVALRSRVLAEVATVRPLPPVSTASAHAAPSRKRRRLPALVAAAATVVALGGGTAVVWQPWEQEQSQLSAAEQVLQASDARRVTQEFPNGATATLVVSSKLDQAVVVSDDMPLAPRGKVYELWFQNNKGTFEPAGLMPNSADASVLLDGSASKAQAVGITIEPEGGSKAPTTAPLAMFRLADV